MTLTPTRRDVVTLTEPRPGAVVELSAGSRLDVRFRRPLGASRWRVSPVPGHLLVLAEGDHEFCFLVFDGASTTVRFERRHPEREMAHEVCEVLVVPLSRGRDVRTSRSASPRTA